MSDDREYLSVPIICMTCAYDGDNPVPARDGRPRVDTCKCPKCSKTAYVQHPMRQRFLLAAIVKEMVRMRLDIMDLQVDLEEKEDR